MNTNRSIRALVLVTCAAAAAGCGPKIAKGEGFSIPIPAGWKKVEGEVPLPAGALAIRQKSKANADFMTASVVVTPVAATTPAFDGTSAALCKQVGDALAKQSGAVLQGTSIIDGPMGKTCQTDVLGEAGKHAALGTYVKLPTSAWMVTCNRDPRDVEAAKACEEALRGIKAK